MYQKQMVEKVGLRVGVENGLVVLNVGGSHRK
jgi:hypothetical protein